MRPSLAICVAALTLNVWDAAGVIAEQPADRVDATTLAGKVMCGYQGWFNCEGDGADLGWTHWARHAGKPFAPGNVTVDLWPDVSELGESERFATGFRHPDGRLAEVFSSHHRDTVVRHFRWMREYGIDGAFVQRFANGLDGGKTQRHKDKVLASVRTGAAEHGRAYAVMYDLSGLRAGQVDRVRRDWQTLSQQEEITSDENYLHHRGKPVVAVWGIGFNDDRSYSLQECRQLIQRLRSMDCTIMLGVPSWWRDGGHDAVSDPLLHEIIQMADIVSPWTIGRYRSPSEATRHANRVWQPDVQWCQSQGIDFLPVVFPGFSWHNLHGGELDSIPRLQGAFLWSQVIAAKRAGCEMLYVAMFDEVDEGTAIFKVTDMPPVGEDVQFLDNAGLPSDHYLRLVGQAGRMLRGELAVTDKMPQ